MIWRTGSKVPINVYDGDRPVCQCQTASDAKLIVKAVNKLPELEAERDALNVELDAQSETLKKLLAVHEDSEAENAALRKALEILAKRRCGSFCTEKDKDGNERCKEIEARCAACIAKEVLSRIPEAKP